MASRLEIRIDPSLADILALGVVLLDGIDIDAAAARGDEADRSIEALTTDLRGRLENDPEARAAFTRPARDLYRAFGIDPTRRRPSSEQIMRRIARGEPFPRVNPLVDAVNLCQLAERLPYGLYDLDALEPPITARAGRPGEGYEGIRKGFQSLDGRPALFDRRGPFGNPTSDSDRAAFRRREERAPMSWGGSTGETRRALAVVFGSPAIGDGEWHGILERTAAMLERHAGATAVERRIVRGGER